MPPATPTPGRSPWRDALPMAAVIAAAPSLSQRPTSSLLPTASLHLKCKSSEYTCMYTEGILSTVPTCNSCTKCAGSQGTDAWMVSQLNVALIRKVCRSLMCLAYFYTRSSISSMGVCATKH